MVFICGLINIFITVTKVRKYIIKAIPRSLQNAIGGGIGIFVAYIGLLNVGIINFGSGVPALATLNQPAFWLFLIGLALTIVLLVCKVKGAILIGIVADRVDRHPDGRHRHRQSTVSFTEACQPAAHHLRRHLHQRGPAVAVLGRLAKLPLVLVTIFSFSLSDTFDTIGTFIGTGRRTGIFSEEDERAMETTRRLQIQDGQGAVCGLLSPPPSARSSVPPTPPPMWRAPQASAPAAAPVLTSVVVALCFAISAFLATFVSAIPFAATAPALVVVGIMMMSAFKEIQWDDFDEAVPAFFAGVFMALCYSISYGIAAGFIFYCITKICKKQAKRDSTRSSGLRQLYSF